MVLPDYMLSYMVQSKHKWSGSINRVCRFSCGSSGLQLSLATLAQKMPSKYPLNSCIGGLEQCELGVLLKNALGNTQPPGSFHTSQLIHRAGLTGAR